MKRDNRLDFGELAIQILFCIYFINVNEVQSHWEISWYKFNSSNNLVDQFFLQKKLNIFYSEMLDCQIL